MVGFLAQLIACTGAPSGITSPVDTPSDTALPPEPFTIPSPSCVPHDNMSCFDDGTYARSSDGCACVSEELLCGDDTGEWPCARYDPATWAGGTVTTCSDGGTLAAGPGPEGTWWAHRFDASGDLMGSSWGGPCGSMVVCACCDGVVLDTVVEGDFAPCD